MRAKQGVWAGAIVGLLLIGACAEKSSAPSEAEQAAGSAAAKSTTTSPDPIIGGVPERTRSPASAAAATASPKVEVGGGERKFSVMQAFASDVGGKLDAEDVRGTIDGSADKLRACIAVDSMVTVKLKILPSGAVSDAQAPRSVPNDPKIRDCVAAALRKLVFPQPKGNQPASLAMDLDLRKQVDQ